MRLVLTLVLATLAGCVSTLETSPVHIAQPVERFGAQSNLSRDGRFYFAAQPDTDTLRRLSERGVVKIINIRHPGEMDEVPFNEEGLVKNLDMASVNLPFPSDELGTGAGDAWVDELADELARTRGPALIHCGTSNRAGAAWGRYLRLHRGFSAQDALLRARAAGMTSERFAEWVASPVPYSRTTGGRR